MLVKLTLIFLLAPHLLIGQYIKGKIIDTQSKKPVSEVHIYIKNESTGTTSDKEGKFLLTFKVNKTDILCFSKVGYLTQEIEFFDFKKTDFTILLEKKVEKIDAVTVHSKRLKSTLKFTKIASMKHGLYSCGTAIVDGKLCIIGGNLSKSRKSNMEAYSNAGQRFSEMRDFRAILSEEMRRASDISINKYNDRIQIFDIKDESWIRPSIKIDNRAYHNVVKHNNKLYAIGGLSMSKNKRFLFLNNTIDVYDISTNEKSTYHFNPHQAINFASALYKNYIITMGGSVSKNKDGTKEYTNKAHFLNLTTGDWFELPDMPKAKETNGVVVGDKIYLIGGYDGSPLSEIESFDLVSEKWKKEGDLFHAVDYPALAVNDKIIYILGNGKFSTFDTVTKTLREYNIRIPLKYSQLQYYNNCLYVIGGLEELQFSLNPAANIFKIDLEELERTKSIKK